MGPLRWILLVIGIALIAAIYWNGRRREREREETLLQRARREDPEPAAEPGPDADAEAGAAAEPELEVGAFDADELTTELHDIDRLLDSERERPGAAPAGTGGSGGGRGGAAAPAERGTAPERPSASPERPADERIVVIYVVAPRGERLVGARLYEAFVRHGLEHGELDIFHARDDAGYTTYSLANGVEPGTFDPATMDTLSTPGVALFLRLPGPPSAEAAFDRMVADARALAEELEAHVLDGRHSTFTRQTEQHLRDEMRELDLRRGRKRP